jgi:acyl-CoA thioester hydrolase
VIYADTDAMGIVYHTNYIKWFEIGRTELLRNMGIVYSAFESRGYNLPLTKAYCHYLLPARYDQVLLIETDIEYMKRASIQFNYTIREEKKEAKLVEGYTVHACTNNDGRIVRIPQDVIDMLDRFENKLNQEHQCRKKSASRN